MLTRKKPPEYQGRLVGRSRRVAGMGNFLPSPGGPSSSGKSTEGYAFSHLKDDDPAKTSNINNNAGQVVIIPVDTTKAAEAAFNCK